MPASRIAIDLRLAVVLLVLVPLLAVFGVGGLVVLGAVERQLEERLQEDISLIARTLKPPISRALERERERAMDLALRSTLDLDPVYGIYVYDADGTLVSRADRLPGQGTRSAVSYELRELETEEHLGDYRFMGGQEVFSLFTPLTNAGGQVIGMLQITRQVSEMRNYVNELRWHVLPLLLAFATLFILIVIFGHHVAIGRPLRRLGDTMHSVGGGNTHVRAVPGGPREIRNLGQRFNLMLQGISDRDRVLSTQREARIRLMEQLRESEKYALAGRLAAGVAHELGAPLSVVDGHAQRLLRRQSPGSSEHDALTRIRDAAGRMAEVVQHLLGFGRTSVRQQEKISVKRIVGLAAADVRTLFVEAGTELKLLPGSTDAGITADGSRLREALTHLLRNALHAARGGSVKLGWRVSGSCTSIFVEDSGCGVRPEDRERIFEPFFTTRKPGEGSGLGLAVVRGIVADHGAGISVYTSECGGAGFRIDFSTDRCPA